MPEQNKKVNPAAREAYLHGPGDFLLSDIISNRGSRGKKESQAGLPGLRFFRPGTFFGFQIKAGRKCRAINPGKESIFMNSIN